MSKFRFWATIVLALALGALGFWIASFLPLPKPLTSGQTKALYVILGILIGLLSFARIASWVVSETTKLTRKVMTRLAAEIINQFTALTSRGLALIPGTAKSDVSEDFSGVKISNAVIVDTSSIIDGRLLDVARSGFLSGILLIPDFVLRELQQVADSADALKRSRGRRGFEIVKELKKTKGVKVEVWDHSLTGKSVDDKIVRLGKSLKSRVLTCDYNLAQVATLSNVQVLNINDLANALKSLPIPGEKMNIKISQIGKDKSQGVGYLQDGTMVVIKDAAPKMNKEIDIEVTKILQGPAGRMVFGKISD